MRRVSECVSSETDLISDCKTILKDNVYRVLHWNDCDVKHWI